MLTDDDDDTVIEEITKWMVVDRVWCPSFSHEAFCQQMFYA
jgi:hypothetical protein